MTAVQVRVAMAEAARSYIGLPFFHAGRDINGLDCVGLLVLAARDVGVDVFDETSYSPIINAQYLRSRIDRCCYEVPPAFVGLGDMLLFRVGRSEQHMAIVTCMTPLMMTHSFQTVGRVVEHELDQHWKSRLAGCFRLKESLTNG
jgi:hypothetical protein